MIAQTQFQMSFSENNLSAHFVKQAQKCDQGPLKTWFKVLQFVSQVWINCECQVNLYSQPCGTLFATIAKKLQKSRDSNITAFQNPIKVLYFLALEFGGYIDSEKYGKISAGIAVLFIKWGSILETEEELSLKSWFSSFGESSIHVKTLGWSGPILEVLEAICITYEGCSKEASCTSDVLELVASAAENAALRTKKVDPEKADAGAHVIGITARAIFQAYKITQL